MSQPNLPIILRTDIENRIVCPRQVASDNVKCKVMGTAGGRTSLRVSPGRRRGRLVETFLSDFILKPMCLLRSSLSIVGCGKIFSLGAFHLKPVLECVVLHVPDGACVSACVQIKFRGSHMAFRACLPNISDGNRWYGPCPGLALVQHRRRRRY